MVLHHRRQHREEITVPDQTLHHILCLHRLRGGYDPVPIVIPVEPCRYPVVAHAHRLLEGGVPRGLPCDASLAKDQGFAAFSIAEFEVTNGESGVEIVAEGGIFPGLVGGVVGGNGGFDVKFGASVVFRLGDAVSF